MSFSLSIAALRDRAAKRAATPATTATLLPGWAAAGSRVATVATNAKDLKQSHSLTPNDAAPRKEDATTPVRAHARAEPADVYAPAREAMHRLGHCDGEAEAQLEAVLQTVPVAIVTADLHAIGDERGLPPVTDPAQEMHAERLQRRGLRPPVIAPLAPKLAKRDPDGVDLHSCAECARFARIGSSRGVWFCQHPSTLIKHGCHGPDILFRCDGFLRCC